MAMKYWAINSSKDENDTITYIRKLYKKYPIPQYVKIILIEEGHISLGTPYVLILDTLKNYKKKRMDLFEVIVHEQYHWYAGLYSFVKKYKYYKEWRKEIIKKYGTDWSFKKYSSTKEDLYDSIGQHIMVCFLTYRFVKKYKSTILDKADPYYEFEKMIRENYDDVEKDVKRMMPLPRI